MTVITKSRIWLSSPHMSGREQLYVDEAFKTNWIAPLGPNVTAFEECLEQHLNDEVFVAALSSGTAAIHLGLELLGVSKGDEVLCQSFTFTASANPITYVGATPVFIDSEPETWNINPELLEKAIRSRLDAGIKPKAIIAVHLYGMPYQVAEIKAISEKYQIPVLEDSAEALGSMYHNNQCGTLGDLAILSFNGNKIITTSGGGALICRSTEQKQRAVHLATQARDNAPHYQHSVIGYNYRLSNVLAGIGRGQMEVLDKRIYARRANHAFYKAQLNEIDELEFLPEPEGVYSNRWLTAILTPSYEIREKIRLALEEENIDSRPLWKPLHLQPVFKDHMSFDNGCSEDLFNRGLCLPSGSDLTQENLYHITQVIKSIL
ncbi:dTDP-4-amino-4,6-dideoxygalactose transaminase [Zhouia amylolytica]|uniref:dTDP-4-amino-4,6-dideoxygalactose transaminase n=1 Tax=Zhouia amylolytica TaxID=376730 RepID=A0A1I6VKL0_9FLAO|nr:aminotransferase class I/II-fold pyridoxal phosphate-dependent enzyme [Zhouia amylolytica]MCQ0112274.1 aminotransferase class I/II-fold pyridoxal phosphate-dependent enzyme [Zhouia amylolytica]SFT14263.1 dTDP-4-amino-4,6-dideoxygalactose transaminase [Zhouia amylolytica]